MDAAEIERRVKLEMISTILGIREIPEHRLVVIYTAEAVEGTFRAELLTKTITPEDVVDMLEQALEAAKIAILDRN